MSIDNLIMKGTISNLLRFAFVWLLGAALTTNAQTYNISRSVIAGGGGTSSGSNYTLSGTIGQASAGQMSGGIYSLSGGFWGIYTAVQTPGSPFLTITPSGSSVILSWPAASTGFYLQQSASVSV